MAEQRRILFEGLPELRRAFRAADRALDRELVKGLRRSAEPVRADAEVLAGSSIRNMGPPGPGAQDWRRMRVGVTKDTVYVAPRSRSRGATKRRRRNLFDLMTGRSLEPALDANVDEVVERVDDVLANVGRVWETA